jgi:hypothetical protein
MANMMKPARKAARPGALRALAPLLGACALGILPASCSARIAGPLNKDGSARVSVSAALEPRAASLIRRLSAALGSPAESAPLLEGAAIARSLSAAPGVSAAAFANPRPEALEGQVEITHVGDFLSAEGAGSFISFRQGAAGGTCAISVNKETGPELLGLLSPEISGYLAALMAPIATGEDLSKSEYLSLVSAVYGAGLAAEIAGSVITVSADFPGPIRSVKGGVFSGRRADFTIPLPDLLTLEQPLSYEAAWD